MEISETLIPASDVKDGDVVKIQGLPLVTVTTARPSAVPGAVQIVGTDAKGKPIRLSLTATETVVR